MKTLKYILIQIEIIALIAIFIFGLCADLKFLGTLACLLGPVIYGVIADVPSQLEYCENYGKENN